jgi:hypothetical protein
VRIGSGAVSTAHLLESQIGKRYIPRFLASPRARAVYEDAEDPRSQGGSPFEAIDPVENGKPGVLDDLFGVGAAADVGLGEAEHGGVPAVEERLERVLIALSQSADQELLLGFLREGLGRRREIGVRQRADSLAGTTEPLAVVRAHDPFSREEGA